MPDESDDTVTRPGQPSYGRHPHLPDPVKNLDLGCIKFKLLQPTSRLNWRPEQADLVEEEYRKFLTLRLKYPDRVIVPEAALDSFWHQHILDTEKYFEDCHTVFGEYMHHFPYFGLRGSDDQRALRNGFEATVELYKREFGEPPPNMWVLRADCGELGCRPGPSPDPVDP